MDVRETLTVLACVQANRANPVMDVDGSEKRRCIECRRPIWISPSGLELVAEGAVPLCVRCMETFNEEDGEAELEADPLTEAQRRDLAQIHEEMNP